MKLSYLLLVLLFLGANATRRQNSFKPETFIKSVKNPTTGIVRRISIHLRPNVLQLRAGGQGTSVAGPPFKFENNENGISYGSYHNRLNAFGHGNGGDDDDDSFTEIFYENDYMSNTKSKIGNALVGLILGPILIVMSCWFLWNNEGWAVKRHRSLDEALHDVQSIDISNHSIDKSKFDYKLIHFTDRVFVSDEGVEDIEFGLKRDDSISLSRLVEIYQWVETKTESRTRRPNGTVRKVTYNYSKRWCSQPVSSSYFRKSGHENYGGLPFESRTFYAKNVYMGPFELSRVFISQMNEQSSVPMHAIKEIPHGGILVGPSVYFPVSYQTQNDQPVEAIVVSIDDTDKIMYKVTSTGEIFSSKDEANRQANSISRSSIVMQNNRVAQIGDVRVSFFEVKCGTVSVVGKLKANTILPSETKQGNGYDVALLVNGEKDAKDMIKDAQEANHRFTYMKRAGGFLINFIGFHLFTSIISTASDVTLSWIPIFGPMTTSLIELGLLAANFVLASSMSLLIISISWLFYRPIIGTPLLLFSFGSFVMASQLGVYVGKNKKLKNDL